MLKSLIRCSEIFASTYLKSFIIALQVSGILVSEAGCILESLVNFLDNKGYVPISIALFLQNSQVMMYLGE